MIIMMRTSNTKCIIIIIICHVSLCIHNLLVVMSKAANNDEWWVDRKCYRKRQIDKKYTDSILTDAYIYEYTRNPLSRSSAQLHFQFYATFVGTSIATHAASFFFLLVSSSTPHTFIWSWRTWHVDRDNITTKCASDASFCHTASSQYE